MFFLLHRLVKWVFIALIAAGVYWAWLQREALEPVYVWYDVYDNGGITQTNRLPVLHGKATHVLDGHTFQLSDGNRVYNVRLTGFEVPKPPLPDEERERELARREFLRNALLTQPASVQVTYSDQGSVLGIVTVNNTNLNLYYLTNDLGRFRRDYIKGLPREMQYQFFAAKRVQEKELQRRTALALQTKTP